MHIFGKEFDSSTLVRRGTATVAMAATAFALASCGAAGPKQLPAKPGFSASAPNNGPKSAVPESPAPKGATPKICHGIIDLASITITQKEAARLAKLAPDNVPEEYLATLTLNHTKKPIGVLAVFSTDAGKGSENYANDKLATTAIAEALGVTSNITGMLDPEQPVGSVEITTGQPGTFPCLPDSDTSTTGKA
jgi:predicted small lipoprotein YifL